jgi:glycosyltransferase involved in cell wall biosynthesis
MTKADRRRKLKPLPASAPGPVSFQLKKVSIIIATRDRPAELRRLLKTLETQTVKPRQVVVVDSSNSPQGSIVREFPKLALEYLPFPTASASRQRNFGVDKLDRKTGVVGFLDDDTLLEPDALRRVLSFLSTSSPRLAGASLNMANHPSLAWRPLKHLGLAERLGLYCPEPGAVVPSGFQTMIGHVVRDMRVQWLPSGAVFWKRAVLDEFRFDGWFADYSYLEDLDLSYRIGKKYDLAVVAGAKYHHLPSPRGRVSRFRFGQKEVLNRVHFVLKNPELSLVKCLIALVARMGLSFIMFLRSGDSAFVQRILGNLVGFGGLLLGSDHD